MFDLDGVLIDSEQVWDDVREQLARELGGRWHEGAQRDMTGMSSPEWQLHLAPTAAAASNGHGRKSVLRTWAGQWNMLTTTPE